MMRLFDSVPFSGTLRPRILQLARQSSACEDVVFLRSTPEMLFIGLADGQSGKSRCVRGGRESLRALEAFVRRRGIAQLLNHSFPDELPCLLMQQIRAALMKAAAEDGGEFADYASTVLAMVLEKATGRYLIAHLGDGCAIGLTENERLLFLSEPQNLITRHHTWLTTDETAVAHMRVVRGHLRDLRRVYLMTDGAERLCRGKNITLRGRKLMTEGTWQELTDYLKEDSPEDDISCVFLDVAGITQAERTAEERP